MKLNQIDWQQSCCGGGNYAEVQTATGDWLMLIKQFLGGYQVSRYGPDKMLKSAQVEMSAEHVEVELSS